MLYSAQRIRLERNYDVIFFKALKSSLTKEMRITVKKEEVDGTEVK
jgi:hypothetical protein